MERITAYLTGDHERLHALLARARSGPSLDGEAFAAFRAGLLRHIGIEEKLLFSAVRRALGAPLPDARRLRVEHAALTSLLVPTPDLAVCADIEALLTTHDAREEGAGNVYAQCDAALGDASSALADRARAYKEVPVAPHFDGHGVVRTAREALASAERIAAARSPA
jgi:hypothetical protein